MMLLSKNNRYFFGLNEVIKSKYYEKKGYKLPDIKFKREGEFYSFYITIDDNIERFYVKKGCLKKNELQVIYAETFYDAKINGHSYMRDEVKITPGDVVIDVGGCEGFYARYALNKGASKVVILEPCKELREGLERTFIKEINQGMVIILPYAVGNHEGVGSFYVDKNMYCSSKIEIDKKNQLNTETISINTLDNIIKKLKLNRVDIIKMDIEGAEIEALLGSKYVLRRYKPKMIIATYHEYMNSIKIKKIAQKYNNRYKIKFSGCYTWEKPFRPFLVLLY